MRTSALPRPARRCPEGQEATTTSSPRDSMPWTFFLDNFGQFGPSYSCNCESRGICLIGRKPFHARSSIELPAQRSSQHHGKIPTSKLAGSGLVDELKPRVPCLQSWTQRHIGSAARRAKTNHILQPIAGVCNDPQSPIEYLYNPILCCPAARARRVQARIQGRLR